MSADIRTPDRQLLVDRDRKPSVRHNTIPAEPPWGNTEPDADRGQRRQSPLQQVSSTCRYQEDQECRS